MAGLMTFIPMSECVERGVYEVKSRNLLVGVYDGKGGFIGIREKFDSRYLFTEYHHDQGPPYGTVQPIKLLNMLPEGIEVWEHYPDPDKLCREGRPTEWRPDDPSKGRTPGWRYHKDDGSRLEGADFPTMARYEPLMAYLNPIDQRLNDEWRAKR